MSHLPRHVTQLLLWGGYCALNISLMSSVAPLTSGMLLISVMLALGLWLFSEALRYTVLTRHWLDLPGPSLVLRIIGAVLLLPMLLQLLIYLSVTSGLSLGWITLPGGVADYRPTSVLMYWLNTVILFGLWTGGWLGFVAVRRYRQGELARLRSEAARSALELDALRARLNPHFVFNALNNVRALINEDPSRARELVTRLSNTLRHALEHGSGEMVTLEHELAVVDDYLAVEQVHYEQRLSIRRAISESALQAKLPPMLLQLLVENAIKHGIARCAGGGEVGIEAQLESRLLRIQVDNPGDLNSNRPGTGVGLDYLRNRIARLKPPAQFSLSADNGRVRASLEIAQP